MKQRHGKLTCLFCIDKLKQSFNPEKIKKKIEFSFNTFERYVSLLALPLFWKQFLENFLSILLSWKCSVTTPLYFYFLFKNSFSCLYSCPDRLCSFQFWWALNFFVCLCKLFIAILLSEAFYNLEFIFYFFFKFLPKFILLVSCIFFFVFNYL